MKTVLALSATVLFTLPAVAQSPNTLLHSITSPSPSTGDHFGYAVAVSGTKMVVGVPHNDTGSVDAGRAYVYDLSSATPTIPLATLDNPSPASVGVLGDEFGAAVAIAGTRVVVGTPWDDAGGENAGRVYVYDLASATPTLPVATLNNPGPAPGLETLGAFGLSVAISGSRLVVGAPRNTINESEDGKAYVYDLASATPTVPVATLNSPSPAAGEYFGYSVAISATRVVVGTPRDDRSDDGTNAGSAYVYDLASATPTIPVATLINPSSFYGPAGDVFGTAVAISGAWVVIGTPGSDSSGGTDANKAYVYNLGSATPTFPVIVLNNPSPYLWDHFGCSVALSGTRMVVGAHGDDDGVGIAYVYELTSATPAVPVATLSNPSPAGSGRFGFSVTIDGTLAAIGTPYDSTVTPYGGIAYVYGPIDGDGDGLRDPWEITHFGTQYGHSALDDFDHDGYSELLEVALGVNPTLPNAGGLPPVVNEGGYLTMMITKQPGVTYEVQSAGTLLPSLPDSFSPTTTTVLINDATTLKVRDNFLINATTRRFIRVKVTAAP